MKAYISKVTGLQVGFTTEWVVLDNGEWRTLTEEEKALCESEGVLAQEAEAKQLAEQAKQLALDSITITTTSGKVFDGRDKDQIRMLSAIQASELLGQTETQWKLADNTVATVTLDELKEAHAMAIQAIGMIILGGE